MDLEKEINDILFKLVKEIKIHRLNDNNSVLEVDYNKYTAELLKLFLNYLNE